MILPAGIVFQPHPACICFIKTAINSQYNSSSYVFNTFYLLCKKHFSLKSKLTGSFMQGFTVYFKRDLLLKPALDARSISEHFTINKVTE